MAKVYVGTYAKYNNGSIAGGWLDLADFATYGDFLAACRKLHKNESDPEFMIQDTDDFPDGLDCMEWLSESDFNDVKAAMNEDKPKLSIVEYSEKAFAVIGDTKPVKDELKKLGGRFNAKLSCGAGWIFPLRARESVEAFIGGGVVTVNVKVEKKDNNKFTEWLDEFIETMVKYDSDKKYYRSQNVGAIKIGEHYSLINKPHINNRFCFRDEGPNYEFYKTLCADDNKMRQYFINKNEAEFTNRIDRIEKGERVGIENTDYENQINLYIGNSCSCNDYGRDATDEERNLILEGLKYGLQCFHKRLDTYLKRYGLSKLHTLTYWADA